MVLFSMDSADLWDSFLYRNHVFYKLEKEEKVMMISLGSITHKYDAIL